MKVLTNAEKCSNFALATPRDGAVVARWAHNPKVRGSSPLPATNQDVSLSVTHPFSFIFFYIQQFFYSAILFLYKQVYGSSLRRQSYNRG